MPVIELSDETYRTLQSLAIPFVDTPESVIRRLLAKGKGKSEPNNTNVRAFPLTPSIGIKGIYTHQKPTSFRFCGKQSDAFTFKEIYLGLCRQLAELHSDSFSRVFELRGRQRRFFADSPHGMTHPHLIPSTSVYAETNFSAESIMERCTELLALFGHSQQELEVDFRPDDRALGMREATAELKERSGMTWVEAIKVALRKVGGKASLFDLYRSVPSIRGGSLPNSFDAIIRGTIESHSSDTQSHRPGNPDFFYSVDGIGSGIWGLRAEYMSI